MEKHFGGVMYTVSQNCANSPIKPDKSLKHSVPEMQYDSPKEQYVHDALHSAVSSKDC